MQSDGSLQFPKESEVQICWGASLAPWSFCHEHACKAASWGLAASKRGLYHAGSSKVAERRSICGQGVPVLHHSTGPELEPTSAERLCINTTWWWWWSRVVKGRGAPCWGAPRKALLAGAATLSRSKSSKRPYNILNITCASGYKASFAFCVAAYPLGLDGKHGRIGPKNYQNSD